MGQGQYQHSNPVLDQNWVPLKRDANALFTNVNPYAKRALYNKATNAQVEEYELQFVSDYDYSHYLVEMRKRLEPTSEQRVNQNNHENYFNLSPYIYTVWYFVDNNIKDMCSTILKGSLFVPKVDLRLKEINDIPLADQLYLTKATLQGFKLLYEKVGYFDISEEMIFITKEGKVKVWINSNLSKNEPIFIPSTAYRQLHGSQSEMVVQLLDLIDQNSDSQQHNDIRFKQYLMRKRIYNRLSFYRALEEFEAYCKQNRYLVDSAMKSIYQLYHMEPENSEVVDVSVNPYNEPRKSSQRSSNYEPSLERKNVYRKSVSDLQAKTNQDSQMFLFGSKTSKRSEYQPRFTHHPQRQEEIYRPRSNNNSLVEKLPQRIIRAPNEMLYQHNQLPQRSSNRGYFVNSPDFPPVRKEAIPAGTSMRPATQLPRRSQNLPAQNNFNYQVPRTKPTLIKFSYKPTENYINQEELHVNRSNSNYLSKLSPHLITVQSIHGDSAASTKEMSPFQSQGTKDSKRNHKIFNSDEAYTLDKEIADDLEKFLGYIQRK